MTILTALFCPGFATVDEDIEKDISLQLFYATVAATAANLGLIVISHTLSHHSLLVSSFFTLIVGFIPSFIILYFGVSFCESVSVQFLFSFCSVSVQFLFSFCSVSVQFLLFHNVYCVLFSKTKFLIIFIYHYYHNLLIL